MRARAAKNVDHAAWSSAMAATVLGAVGVTLDLILSRHVPNIVNEPAAVSIAGSTVLLVFLWRGRARPSAVIASIVFVVNAAFISYGMFMRDPYFAQLENWVPFQAAKLGCIAAALLGPQLWSALVGIGLHAGGALVALATLDPVLRQRASLEPMATLGFALVGAVLAYDRHRRLSLERDVAHARAEVAAAEQLARTVLAIRELANTPIQTIELCNELMRTTEQSDHPRLIDRIDRSTSRLRDLSELLLEYEASAKWRDEDTAMNAERLLAEGAHRVRRTTGQGQ